MNTFPHTRMMHHHKIEGDDEDTPPLVNPDPEVEAPGNYKHPADLPIPGEEPLDKSQLGG